MYPDYEAATVARKRRPWKILLGQSWELTMVDYMCDVSRGQLRTQLKIKLVLRRRDANWEADQDVVHQNQIRETPSNLGSLAKFTSLGGLFLSYTIFSEIILKKNLQRISLLDLLFFFRSSNSQAKESPRSWNCRDDFPRGSTLATYKISYLPASTLVRGNSLSHPNCAPESKSTRILTNSGVIQWVLLSNKSLWLFRLRDTDPNSFQRKINSHKNARLCCRWCWWILYFSAEETTLNTKLREVDVARCLATSFCILGL